MAIGIGIDVYGTMVDPLGMNIQLRPLLGDAADRAAELWRAKQLEYTFRRALMGMYENFDICTRQALLFVLETLGLSLTDEQQQALLAQYQHLPPYPDALPALKLLRAKGFAPRVFSNGVEATLRELLGHGGLLPYLDAILSVDAVKTFKPDPRVYRYLADCCGSAPTDTWLVSSNSFDIIGAKAAGLKAAWIRRNARTPLDPWAVQPDLVAKDLLEFAERITA